MRESRLPFGLAMILEVVAAGACWVVVEELELEEELQLYPALGARQGVPFGFGPSSSCSVFGGPRLRR